MNRRVPQFVAFALAIGFTLTGSSAKAQAQSFAGKWVNQGPKGVSVIEFFPGDRRIVGPISGQFHHTIFLDNGRVLEGEGSYVYRSILPNRGWLILHFSDGHVTREHEITRDPTVLQIEHHGVVRTYVRQ